MSDAVDRLKRGFRDEAPVRARDEARKQALSAAMDAFDEENSPVRQGSVAGARLKAKESGALSLLRRLSMTFSTANFKYALAGSASFAVLAIAVINTVEFQKTPVPPQTLNALQHGKQSEPAKTLAAKPNEERVFTPAQPPLRLERENQNLTGRVVNEMADAIAPSTNRQRFHQPVPPTAPAPMAQNAPSQRLNFNSYLSGNRMARGGAYRHDLKKHDSRQQQYYQDQGRDKFAKIEENRVKVAAENPVSTFSVDVDTASYAFVRKSLNGAVLPQKNAVRVEEMINYFSYDYQTPKDRAQPFKVNVSVMPTPWNTSTKLMKIGIKGYELPKAAKPRSNLVFLIDTSGSMNAPDKLPLLINSFKLLLQSLEPEDTVAIVTYAGRAGTVLTPTKASEKAKIISALENLRSGGSTAGAAGIRQAYQLAQQNLNKEGVNRVILATDGDFNVGITNTEELKSYVERKRKTGVTLSVLGFGAGNYNDELMQTLAQNGNGNAAYIDTLNEARKVLVEQAGSTLFTIAKDVKIQVEFNPQTVGEYRLIGYETRILNREDFNNDKVDAGDIGSGHSVTALYEITPKGNNGGLVDGLRYQNAPAAQAGNTSNEYAFVKIRYKLPKEDTSTLVTTPVTVSDEAQTVTSAPADSRFAAAVSAFGQILRGGKYTGSFSYDDIVELAQGARGADAFGYRSEFINLVRLAKSAAAMEPQKQ